VGTPLRGGIPCFQPAKAEKVRVNGTKQRALLKDALRLDENFCRLVQFCFPRRSDAVSTTSASEYDAI